MLSTVQHVFLRDQHSQFQPEESTAIATAINSNLFLFVLNGLLSHKLTLVYVVEPEEAQNNDNLQIPCLLAIIS